MWIVGARGIGRERERDGEGEEGRAREREGEGARRLWNKVTVVMNPDELTPPQTAVEMESPTPS